MSTKEPLSPGLKVYAGLVAVLASAFFVWELARLVLVAAVKGADRWDERENSEA